jgi:hypothetical protein
VENRRAKLYENPTLDLDEVGRERVSLLKDWRAEWDDAGHWEEIIYLPLNQ